MNEFNVLLAAATNGTPSGSLFDALFARYIAPQESWRELESPLPITILAAGEDLIDYRIYGNTENGESVGERTENLFDYVSYFADVAAYSQYFSLANIQLSPNTTYTLSTNFHSGSSGISTQKRETPFIVCNTVDSPSTLTGGFGDDCSVSITTTDDGIIELYVRISRGNNPEELCDLPTQSDFENGKWVMIIEGSTAPTSYIPYGYKLPMVVTNGTTTTTTPIYIGPDPLAEDEYVSYSKQKVYRMEGGTLTPTDPPTPIPALPTIQGETTIEYDGGEPEPKQMYVKYRRKD